MLLEAAATYGCADLPGERFFCDMLRMPIHLLAHQKNGKAHGLMASQMSCSSMYTRRGASGNPQAVRVDVDDGDNAEGVEEVLNRAPA